MEHWSLWQWGVVFLVSSGTLIAAAIALAKVGDEIATRTGLGGLLVGMVLVAAVTSMPELVVGVSAAIEDAPALAVGELFGSNMANMAILAFLDLIGRRRVWPAVELGHARVAGIAIALTALAVLSAAARPGLAIGWVGVDTPAIAVSYVAAVAWIRRTQAASPIPVAEELPLPTGWSGTWAGRRARSPLVRLVASAIVILIAGPIVVLSAREIAEIGDIDQTFVGAAALAVVTSLPELVASVAAVRIGAHDLAVGNLFGSNAVNMALLFFVDVAYLRGPLVAAVTGSVEVVAGIGAILLMALALTAIVHGRETRIGRLEPDALLLLLAYVGTLAAVWAVGR